MLTLAVDTTADYGSIALADENGCREEVLLNAPRGFSHVLFGEIAALLERKRVRLSDIELFAGASGPGSFTGVRVGLSAIKGLAEVLSKPAAAVSNLRVLAELGTSDFRVPIFDAHRGQIYGAVFDADGQLLLPEIVTTLPKFLGLVPKGDLEWISPEPDIITPALTAGSRIIHAPRAIASLVAAVAIRTREGRDPALIEGNYVRRSDAELLFRG